MLTQSFEDMLYLFGAGARGEKVHFEHEINLDEIRNISLNQGVWQTVYTAVPDDNSDKSKYKASFLKSVTNNMMRNEFTLHIIEELEKQGISCCMLKGMTIAKLYKEPSCRVSGDVDILIEADKEKSAMNALAQLGYKVEPRGRNSHHFLAGHPRGGLLEVHIEMYSDPTRDILLSGKLKYEEERMILDIDGKHLVKTLSIDDGAVYMTAHYIKHFISKGVGVRQLMDLLLYLEEYGDRINWKRYYEIFDDLKYTKLIKNLYAIGNKYFGAKFEDVNDECIEAILTDTQSGGTFGGGNEGIEKFYEVFTQRKTDMSREEYEKYMYTKKNATMFRRLFPYREVMKKNGYKVRNTPELLIRYIQRLWKLSIMIISKKEVKKRLTYNMNDVAVNDEIKTRLKMMEDLEII
ncbi:MAG: hypothetical protein E7415_03130 [Ruminococcaceae bacterium]|nr:hypothetical protein [Oscillospiraceae bacterium]